MDATNDSDVRDTLMDYYRHIDRSSIQFDFVIPSDAGTTSAHEIQLMGGKVYAIPRYASSMMLERHFEHLFREHYEWDIVQTHMGTASTIPLRAAMRCGVHVRIAHAHDSDAHNLMARDKRLWRRIDRMATVHFASSESLGSQVYKKARHIMVVPDSAIDFRGLAFSETKRMEFRAKVEAGRNTFVVGCIGPIGTESQLLLLDAFSKMLSSRPDSLLVLLCEGSTWQAAEDRVLDLGLWNNVRFLGAYQNRGNFLCGCDCLCVPTSGERVPRVVKEARASGLPVLMEYTGVDNWGESLARLEMNVARAQASHTEQQTAGVCDIQKAAANLQRAYEMLSNWAKRYNEQ